MTQNQTGKGLRIFVVDDHRDIADGLAEVLRFHGHEVEVAYTGEQAVRVFRERDFDIAFMDVMMPGMNGVESFLAIRRIKPHARVVMMTGYSVEQLLDQVVEKGAYGVLHKPVSMDEVLGTLERVKSNGLVLIADADDKFGGVVQGVLEKNGYRTCTARTGKEALSKVLAGGVDILVLGQSLPVLSGIEVYMELRKRSRDLPTVIMSEGDYVSELENVYRFESTGILTKPFNTEQLMEALGRINPCAPVQGMDPLADTPEDYEPPKYEPAPSASTYSAPAEPVEAPAAPAPAPAVASPEPAPADPAPVYAGSTGETAPPPAAEPARPEAPLPEAARPDPARPEPARAEPARAELAPAEPEGPYGKMPDADDRREGRILAVDDDVDMVEGLAEVLRTRGYEVETANTAVQAMDIAKDFDAEVALLDIRLGKTNGLELIASLKEVRPDIYCVMITGNADKESAISALKRGAFNYLTKPLHPHELFAVLDNCLDKHFLDQRMREAFLRLQTDKEEAEAHIKRILDLHGDLSGKMDSLLETLRDSSVSMVEQGPDDADRAKDMLDNISQVRGILNFSNDLVKAESDLLEVAEEEVDICAMISDAAEMVRRDLGYDRREIDISLPSSPPVVWGDSRLLRMFATNLIAGAVEAAPSGSAVEVSVQNMDDGTLAIEMSHGGTAPMGVDEGAGDSPASAARSLRMSLITHIAQLHGGVAEGKVSGDRAKLRMTLPAQRVMVVDQVAQPLTA